MARCEDYPCCGHESGCCPDYDADGKQLNMKCTCGATVPLTSRYSLCQSCMRTEGDERDMDRWEDEMIHGRDDENEY
jgi:hypothetical protein